MKRPFQCRNLLSSTVAWCNLLVCLLKNVWIVFFSFDYCNCRDYLGCLADGGREDLWHPGYVRRRKVKSLMQKRKGLFTQRSGTPALINLECKQALTPPPKLSEILKLVLHFMWPTKTHRKDVKSFKSSRSLACYLKTWNQTRRERGARFSSKCIA